MCEPRLFLSLLGNYSFRKRRTQQIMASGLVAMNLINNFGMFITANSKEVNPFCMFSGRYSQSTTE